MIDIGAGHYIRPEQVKEMRWENIFYANGSDYRLVILMFDGTEHRVLEPKATNVERKILAVVGRG